MTRTEFLRQQTISGANKCRRTPIPPMSVANEPCSLSERKALALKMTFDTMPVYIGPKELIEGRPTILPSRETRMGTIIQACVIKMTDLRLDLLKKTCYNE